MLDNPIPLVPFAFSNGTEFEMWLDANCRRCKFGNIDSFDRARCDLRLAIYDAMGDHTIPASVAGLLEVRNREPALACPQRIEGTPSPDNLSRIEYRKKRESDLAALKAWNELAKKAEVAK